MIDPDPIARDYLLLALRLDRLIPGLVDGYFGPAGFRLAGAVDAPAGQDSVAALVGGDDRLIEFEPLADLADGGGLPAGDDEAI